MTDQEEPRQRGSLDMTRRRFLGGATAAGIVAYVDLQGGFLRGAFAATPTPAFTLRLLRRDDALDVTYRFYGVLVSGGALVGDPAASASQRYVTVTFPVTSIDEGVATTTVPGGAIGPKIARAGRAIPLAGPSTDPPAAQSAPVPVLPSGATQVAFNLATLLPLTLDSAHLLDWSTWPLRVDQRSSPQDYAHSFGAEAVQAPTADVTALEVAYDLIFSPGSASRFATSPAAVAHPATTTDGTFAYTETWHARLASGTTDSTNRLRETVSDPTAPTASVAALWSRGYGANASGTTDFPASVYGTQNGASYKVGAGQNPSQTPFDSPLHDADRTAIIDNSSNYRNYPSQTPTPITANQLMLTSEGAILDLSAQFPGTALDPSFASYDHRSWLGRDYYVKTERRGFLLPFGHRATHITLARREVDGVNDGGINQGEDKAILAQQTQIIVTQPTRTYGDATVNDPNGTHWSSNNLRGLPLRSVTFRTLAALNLDSPVQVGPGLAPVEQGAPAGGVSTFFPTVNNGNDVPWTLDALDWAGNPVHLSMPLMFVEGEYAGDDSGGNFASLIATYNGAAATRRSANLGQRVALAQTSTADASPGATTVETAAITLQMAGTTATHAQVLALGQVPLWPLLQTASVVLSPVRAVGGSAGSAPVNAVLPDAYTGPNFDPTNPVEGFLSLVDKPPLGLSNPSTIGGLAIPNYTAKGVGRTLGVMGLDPQSEVQSAAQAQLAKVDDYFPAGVTDALAQAKLLGGLTLSDLLDTIRQAEAQGIAAAQAFVAPLLRYEEYLPPTYDPRSLIPKPPATMYTVTLAWTQPLAGVRSGGPVPGLFVGEAGSTLTINGTFHTDVLHPEKSTALVVGTLTNAMVNLIGDGGLKCLVLDFDHLRFTTGTGRKPNLDVGLRSVAFGGVLTFVNQLQAYLKTLGSPLAVDVTSAGVSAAFSLALPTIGVGVFTLANVAISIGANLPFTGGPARARFAFCSREHPFCLTVSFFGGGGFFAIAAGTDGLEQLEASLEFGAAAALDLGVASGSVSLMAGIYFKYAKAIPPAADQGAQLSGFLDCTGELEVLGLITYSANFHMQFQYDFGTNKVIGRATLTVEVSVLFFSKSISLSIERRFGGGGDPNFSDLYAPADWSAYCGAFAPEVAA